MYLSALLAYPLLEILVSIYVAKLIGWSNVVMATIATTFLGLALIRMQRRWQIFGRNDFSAKSLENYLFGNLGAFALILPGFLSDFFGLLIVVPWTRRLLLGFLRFIRFDVNKAASGPFSVFKTYSFSRGFQQSYDPRSPNGYGANYDEIVDVESYGSNDADDSGNSNVSLRDDEGDDDAIDVEFTVR